MMKSVLFLLGLMACSAMAADSKCIALSCATDLATDNCFEKDTGDNGNHAKITACEGDGAYCLVPSGFVTSQLSSLLSSYACYTPDTDTDEEEDDTTTTTYKSLTSITCSSNDDCSSGSCSGNLCTGLDEGETCVTWSVANASSTSSSNREKVCGKGLYCNSSNVCTKGADAEADCDYDYECDGRMGCVNSKCVEIGSLATGDTCSGKSNYCPTDNFCKSSTNKCAEATDFSKYLDECTSNDDCGEGNCTICVASDDGTGRCNYPTTDNGKDYYNDLRSALGDADFKCMLEFSKGALGGCGGSADLSKTVSWGSDSCFSDFNFAYYTGITDLKSVQDSIASGYATVYSGAGSSSASVFTTAFVAFMGYFFYF